MEKFSGWRDRGTGISPFMPQALPTFRKNILASIFYKLPVFFLKLPFFIIASILYAITGFTSILSFVFSILFGFTTIDYSVDGIKKSQLAQLEVYKPRKGDLIVSNYISPMDGYFFALLSGTSRVVILVPDKSGDLYEYSPSSLSDSTFAFAVGSKVEDVTKFKNKVVFLLLEGTPSNNQAILPFVRLNPKYSFEDFAIKSLVLKISPNYFTLPVPNIGKLQYFFELVTSITQKHLRAKIYKFDAFDVPKIRKSFELNSLASISGDLDIDAKNKFVRYYADHTINKN
ncbi:Lysophosphatidic acid:oleoyl-CoA acyltransferase 1 [Candida viswanathii]|uniref:Lysophosphatidic acid:oleoyl-CoA acyltransferase 1 n=1 Tax=Candida viswanathii TaxID=5486 RepID=A0A367XRX7_9ASCO|nr:Lysophosphatidic acid:oleoyl-CoA acyltransferase 1 [Candida viswanathii]